MKRLAKIGKEVEAQLKTAVSANPDLVEKYLEYIEKLGGDEKKIQKYLNKAKSGDDLLAWFEALQDENFHDLAENALARWEKVTGKNFFQSSQVKTAYPLMFG